MLPKLVAGQPDRAHRRRLPGQAAVLALAAVALLSSCQRAEEQVAPEVRPVRTLTVAKGAGGGAYLLTGAVQAQSEINQSFRIDGRLLERSLNVGDAVRPGQLIARLDPQNEESSLLSARAQLTGARARLAEAENNFTRMRDLVAENAVSRASFDQAEAGLKTAQAQVESAQSQVTLAENRLGYTRLTSTVAGVVTAQGAEPGEVVGAGRMIVQIAREGARDAVLDVPARIKDVATANPEIVVALTADPKITAKGVVREVSPRADPVTGTFRFRIRLIDPPAAMRLGTTVTARLSLASAAAIEIPPSAVTRSDRQASVWVVDPKTGTVAARAIEIRSSDPQRVEIASGLAPGDVVVTAGVQALRAGQKVRLLEARQ
ncbi:MAG TPA: efflux RND transporter periplasmic adaptor subunit [Casimicrobiaceae bacterium]|nr:efflux RND transporter periplasmic adaptor subunit [Casimicrobiaceae bacterium]